MIVNFEKLEVWQLSRDFSIIIHKTLGETNLNKYGELVKQLRKSAISISSNIAEGSARKTLPDKRKFISIAYGSAVEALSQLILCCDLSVINENDFKTIRLKLERLMIKILAFYNSIN